MQEYNCPYFISAKHEASISCELAMIRPPDKEAKTEFIDKFCGAGDGYKNCPLCSILDNYYKRKYADWEGRK